MVRRAEAERERRTGAEETAEREEHGGPSKVKLALGAAGLLLFILGVRRTFRTEEGLLAGVAAEADETDGGSAEAGPKWAATR